MWALTFDTATMHAIVAVGRIDRATGEHELVAWREGASLGSQASASLVTAIETIVVEAGIRVAELRLLCCGRGPGTFTGARVAVATAMGLALGLGLQVHPVSTLAALAASVDEPQLVLATLDARRHEVYAAMYRHCRVGHTLRLETIVSERCASITSVLADVRAAVGNDPFVIAGCELETPQGATPVVLPPRSVTTASPRGLWLASVQAMTSEAPVDPSQLDAAYLRASYAELGLNRPKRPFVPSPFA